MEKIIYINVDDYNMDSISTIKGNNNAEVYKIYLQADNEKIDLTGKTVNLAFLKNGSTEGDIIKNLNVTDPKNGEITLKITNKITKQNGTYSCQLAISGEDNFLEHTATFSLTVENNIFSDISNIIADSKDLTYIEAILDKASKISETLKDNTSNASNINTALESNITEANNINSKLLENTSTATSLNKNLESNIDLAKEVKETIKDLDTKNIEATEKIETLTGLNAKATELSNNIQQGLPLNSELVRNTESAKVANTNLAATNQEATTKNTELQASLEKTKEFIDGLDGSQNIPQLRLDVTELQNGLKSNQALAYTGSSISADNTLEGRTESLKIEGRTLQNLIKNESYDLKSFPITLENNYFTFTTDGNFQFRNIISNEKNLVPSTEYTIIYEVKENTLSEGNYVEACNTTNFNSSVVIDSVTKPGIYSKRVLTKSQLDEAGHALYFNASTNNALGQILKLRVMLLKGNLTDIPNYFEGIKSFGEAEGNKISILSSGKNLLNMNDFYNTLKSISNNGIFEEKKDGRDCIKITQLSNYWYKGYEKIKFKEKTRYTFTGTAFHTSDNRAILTIKYNDGSYLDISVDANGWNKFNFTSDANKTIKGIFSAYTTDTWAYIDKNTFMIEEDERATNYEPYKEDKKDILIKEPLREGDYLYEDNGQVKVCRDVKQYTFTGDENITIHQQINGLTRFRVAIPNNSKIDYFAIKFCDNLKINSDDRFFSNIQMSIGTIVAEYQTNNNCYMIFDSDTTTVEQAKIKLKELRPTIVYQLATPVTEIVENCVDIDLDTYQDKTYFSINNTIPGSLDFKVPSNIASIVQNTAREVNNIWDVINNLLVPSLIDINKNVALATIKNNLK